LGKLHAELIVDDVGRTVNVNVPVKSIVSLSPAHTEIIFMLKQQYKLKAVSVQCDFPEPAKKMEKAGTFLKPDIEKIIKIRPDVVISGGGIQKQAIYELNKLKIPVLVLYPKNIKAIADDTRIIGWLTGAKKQAEIIAREIEDFKHAVTKTRPVKVYIELWGSPAMSVGGASCINDIVETAGGMNIFKDSVPEYPKVSKEEIIKRNPDVIILLYEPEKDYSKRQWFEAVNAGKNKNIFVFNEKESDFFLRPGPRVVEGVKIMKEMIAKAEAFKNEK
jgi:iron complex transport system substrate-binding protein